MISPLEVAKRRLTLATHTIHTMPILVLMPHGRCNCRCLMCDIWKANANGREISSQELAPHLASLRRLNVQWIVLSGGEALMHSNLWALCEQIRALPAKISLLSTGLLLKRHAEDIVRWCDEVVVSLDGSREVHDAIRNVPRAYDRLAEGVAALKALAPGFRVTARSVIQRSNYRDMPGIIAAAEELGLDQISFLAADVSTEAFNRDLPWEDEHVADVALTRHEVADFERILEAVIQARAADFDSGFIAESPAKLRRLASYYRALHGDGDFPETICNAPWVSAVIEADGTVRPCFFHRPLGNMHDQALDLVFNSPQAVAFRRELDVKADPICRKCVCTLKLSLTQQVLASQ